MAIERKEEIMFKYREILRLASMGVSQTSIAFSCGCAQSTVSDVLRAARVHQLSWPLPEEMDDAAIRAVIYPKGSRKSRDKAAIDHGRIASELMRRGMTMSLLWNEYCDDAITRGEQPYMYSAFCREHRDWAQRHDVRMRIEHKPAETIQVDWSLPVKTGNDQTTFTSSLRRRDPHSLQTRMAE